MKNILVIHQAAEMYGSDRMLYLTVTGLDKTKFFPVVVLPQEGPLKTELEKQDIKVVVAPVLKVYRSMFTPKNLIRFSKDIKKGIAILDKLNKQYKFDIVYSNTLAVLLGMMYARKRKIKHVWHVHEIIVHPKIFAEAYPKLLAKRADVVICNSQATESNLVNRQPSLSKKTVVVHNGPAVSKSQREAATKEDFGFSQQDIIITLVGRISRLKGHKWLLNTFTNYLQQTKAKLLLVGSPVPGQEFYEDEVYEIVQTEGLENKVTVLPFTKSLKQIWDVTDIAVMPSTEAESFGLVALEAMLAKKPVVASNHGGVTEIVVNNETGYLVEPSNEGEFADALLKLINSADLRKELGEKGYERAIAEFSPEKYIANISSILEG
ncbi:glycosyltransferase family 4 protein [Flavobacterium alkalisoli]|uniref:Glycosyltransferase family 4 protein n=1 Tax=Flavobacterium alkalisoli TaxID=2602769 RepID=A0A5B9FR84_9FLAO|nr:glycosyltransferase family 4 protein [Flavobacterium alkalisoli]QEE48759.1 glycosyltransferase family 4 protein [Flavobacterium alkalisoli]